MTPPVAAEVHADNGKGHIMTDRPHINIAVNGVKVVALVDSGSSHTLLDFSVYVKLPRLTAMQPAPLLLSLTGNEVDTKGVTTVKIAGRLVDAVICNNLGVDLLIGIDFLNQAVLNFPARVLSIGGHRYPMRAGAHRVNMASVGGEVPRAQTPVVQKVLHDYSTVFSSKSTPVNVARLPPAEIHLTCETPIRQRSYRMPHSKRETVEKCIDEMLKDGIIRPSHSPYASPITLVPKKDGSTRFCVDYRKLNAVTRKDAYPLPHIQDIFDAVQGCSIFSTLDLKSGYWQVPMAHDSIEKTAFTCHKGSYEWLRLPFGLTAAPAIFQRAMNEVMAGLLGKCMLIYIDDLIVFSRTREEHADHLRQVFERLSVAGLQVKPSKCSFEKEEIDLLGYVISKDGIKPQEEKLSAIRNLAPPVDVKSVRSFLGMTGYYRSCVKDYATIALPLTELTKAKQPFVWGEEQQIAFNTLKLALTTAPILAHANPRKAYILYTDASDKAIGAILVQKNDDGMECVIAYLSHKLSETQRRWATIEREGFAVIYALKRFHPYLFGAQFEIHTDHKPLKSLFSAEIRNSKLQRWAIQISEYGAPIMYHPGKLNIRADMLSRIAAVTTADPKVQLEFTEMPTPWQVDKIDPGELYSAQKDEYQDELIEARQDVDGSTYILQNGLLHSIGEPHKNAGVYARLILPHVYRQRVIDRCHQEVGHAGYVKTLARVQECYVWKGMRRAIRVYLSHCVHCRVLTPPMEYAQRGEVPVPPRPFHTWGMDLVGPFPRDQKGQQYLLTAIDHLTGWAEAIPIASKKTANVLAAFNTHIVSRYGSPSILVTDRGGEFSSSIFEKWLAEWGIEHRMTSPYHPQTNGKCERFNGTIQALLLKLTGGNPRQWSVCLNEALLAYRTNINPDGISPYVATFGQRPRLPRCGSNPEQSGERIRNMHSACETLKKTNQDRKNRYLARESKRATILNAGMFVSVRVLQPTKGTPKWRPGFQIIDSRGPALVLRNCETGKTLQVNQQNVRRVRVAVTYDEVDPIRVKKRKARTDYPETAYPLSPTGYPHTLLNNRHASP